MFNLGNTDYGNKIDSSYVYFGTDAINTVLGENVKNVKYLDVIQQISKTGITDYLYWTVNMTDMMI